MEIQEQDNSSVWPWEGSWRYYSEHAFWRERNFYSYHETIGPMKESAVWVEEAPLQTLVWGRRSLSPAGYQQDDPLGLSVEGSNKKFPEDELHELFPEGSGDLTSEQFAAGWFLLEHHHGTMFDDLKAGLAFLRRKVEAQKEGQLSFLKVRSTTVVPIIQCRGPQLIIIILVLSQANVGSVMEQLDTLTILKDKFESDVKEHGSDPTAKVEKAIQVSMLEANKLFEEVLARRDRADATRNALGVLQRFKFLFSLPVSIERNIRKGDYDVVINDYARAKNLFGKTDVPITESVELGGGESGKTPRSTPQSNNKFGSKTPVSQDWQSSVPQRVLFVEELSEITTNMFPDLWKLGQAYFSGELHVKVEPEKQTHFKVITRVQAKGFVSFKQRIMLVSQRMVLAPIELLSGLLRAAILPHTLDRMSPLRTSYGMWPPQGLEGVGPWLPHCLRYIRSTYTSLIRLDLPNEALTIIASLIFDLRFGLFHFQILELF
uniref:Exocyst complex component 2 n=1 Tax=Timema cristinae TaxID=61476 RepID=A0A7R9DBI3_TIMCR|nr:unnamed protein product [Timema cristinae]